ncbi:MAG: DUF6231 family protein [Pseudomonadota bacterium]
MRLDDDELDRLLAQLNPKPESLLILGATGRASTRNSVVGAFSIREFNDTDSTLRADLGVIVGGTPDDVSIIARLRDLHCRRVVLLAAGEWRENDLLGLGFQRIEFDAAKAYLCDPNLTPLREWNNAEHWAHPQNFDKFRE